jgi:site-specific recombinase XerD
MNEDIASFIQELQRQEVAPKTIDNYRSDLVCFARWFQASNGEPFSASAVTPTDVRDYRSHLLNVEARKPATVNRRLAALRKFFAWAKATGLIHDLPTETVKGVKGEGMAPKWLDKREIDRLLRAVERDGNKRNLAILQTLRHTGLRVGELCELRKGDVEISERKGVLTVRSGKGSKYRQVPLNNDVRRALSSYIEVRPATTGDYFFISQRGDGLQPQAVQNLVRKYADLAGLSDVTPHTLRHSFGKQALDAGVNLVTVAKLLGHQRLDTTAIYTQPGERDLEQAVEKLETGDV